MNATQALSVLDQYTAQLRLTRQEQTQVITAIEVLKQTLQQYTSLVKNQQMQDEEKKPLDNTAEKALS